MPSSPASEISELVMPKLGLTMIEGLLAEWRVSPGDAVRAGDVLFVVETDKIANEVEAPSDGEMIEILVDTGATVPVGTPLARWTGAGLAPEGEENRTPETETEIATPDTAHDETGLHPVKTPDTSGESGKRVKATPLARRLARQHSVDLTALQGSGPGGRIKAADVEEAAERVETKASPPAMHAETNAEAGMRIAISGKHASMARRVVAAKRDIPHFYLNRRAEVLALMRLRAEMNAAGGPKVTLNHFILKAVARALMQRPEANRIWGEDALIGFSRSDVGMVVDTSDGLFIPILRDVGRTPMDRLAQEARLLADRAAAGELRREDMEGGAVSVSNIGMAGAESVLPIINPPHSAILGVGAVVETFRPDEAGAPSLRREVTLTLACDHRVFDGMTGARLLEAVVNGLEAPHSLLQTMDV
ncbi:MAG: 2-oxo acid dehydrogenase subunit E2 [Pararhodobacter sp.]|nr:2-oxo acid dehydrogenase subunit E2 [Pararhodobacter sp.]